MKKNNQLKNVPVLQGQIHRKQYKVGACNINSKWQFM
jgi:hypothetical protein